MTNVVAEESAVGKLLISVNRNATVTGAVIGMHLFFAVQFFLAAWFYRERIFTDTSFYFFHAVNTEWFRIEHQRFIAVVGQIWPLIAVWLGAKLHTVLIVHSLGNVLYFYAVFLFCLHGLKDKRAALAVVLFCLICTRREFFTPDYEIWYGMALVPVFVTMLQRKLYMTLIGFAGFVLVTESVLFSHPLMFLPLACLCAIFWWERRAETPWWHVAMMGSLFGAMCLVKALVLDEYETGKTMTLQNIDVYATLHNKELLKGYVFYLLKSFPDLIFMFVCLMVVYAASRRFFNATVLAVFVAGFIALIIVTHNHYDSSLYYDRMHQPVAAAIVMLFLSDVFRKRTAWWYGVLSLFVMLVIVKRTYDIVETSRIYTERRKQMERIVEYCRNAGIRKAIVNERNFEKPYSMMEWSYPIETMILSSLRSPDASVTVASDYDLAFGDNAQKLNADNYMFRRFEIEHRNTLNRRYFSLPSADYTLLNTAAEVPYGDAFTTDRVTVTIEDVPELKAKSQFYVTVRVNNGNNATLPSGLPTINLVYRWEQSNQPVPHEPIRTPLEADIRTSHTQHILVQTPDAPGEYGLVVDIEDQGKGWWNSGGRKVVIVK